MATNSKKTNKKSASKRKRGKKRNFLLHMPSYILWTLLAVVASIYVYFLYTTFISPYSFRWKNIYGTPVFPSGDIRGIDISHYQEEIDWYKLKNTDIHGDPISFIFVKATEGSNIIDENFNQNFYNSKKHEIIRGAYHFFTTTSSVERQARLFCKVVQLEDNDLPPVLDVETKGMYTKEKLQTEVLKWLDIVEKHYGVPPILYTSHKFRTTYLDDKRFNRYHYWIAHYYVDKLTYNGEWKFWQHTDVGKLDGIKGYVDVNIFNGSYADLIDLTIGKNKQNSSFED